MSGDYLTPGARSASRGARYATISAAFVGILLISNVVAVKPIAFGEIAFGGLSLPLVFDGGAVGAAGNDGDPVTARERLEAIPRVTQQRLPGTGEVVQELGCVCARQRPEAATDATGRNNGIKVRELALHGARLARRPRDTAAPRRDAGRPLSRDLDHDSGTLSSFMPAVRYASFAPSEITGIG